MSSFEQHKPIEQAQRQQQCGQAIGSTLNETWGPNAVTKLSDNKQQTSSALDGFGQFCIGFGDGLSHFAIEGAQAVGKAVSNPGEAIHNGVEGVKTAVGATCEAAVGGAGYVVSKVSNGDVAGMANDAVHTGQAIGKVTSQAVDHFNHMSAKEKGYVFGHDVAPAVVGTCLAPELLPEGAIAAGLGKAASVAGALIKEEGIAAKVATTFESAREKMAAISEKIAALNHRMESFQNEIKESATFGSRVRDGKIVRGERISDEFYKDLRHAELNMPELEARYVSKAKIVPVHNMPEASLPGLIKEHGVTKTLVLAAREKALVEGDWNQLEKVIRIAEHTGLKGDMQPNTSVRHALIHETSHMIDDLMGGYEPLSFRQGFRKLVGDARAVNPKAEEVWNVLGNLNANRRIQEIWAHQATNIISDELGLPIQPGLPLMIRQGYPDTYKYIEAFRNSVAGKKI